jgi:hypothetical protein
LVAALPRWVLLNPNQDKPEITNYNFQISNKIKKQLNIIVLSPFPSRSQIVTYIPPHLDNKAETFEFHSSRQKHHHDPFILFSINGIK